MSFRKNKDRKNDGTEHSKKGVLVVVIMNYPHSTVGRNLDTIVEGRRE